MKLCLFSRSLAVIAALSLLWQPAPCWAADNATSVKAGVTTATPEPISPAANEVLKLVNAKITDDTIVAFVGSSTASYPLTAAEIISLRSQGVSERILTAMLARKSGGNAAPEVPAFAAAAPQVTAEQTPAAAAAPAPAPTPAPGQTIYPGGPSAPQPAPTYVQPAPTYVLPPVYYAPSVAPYYPYYPYGYGYGYGVGFPAISFGFGFGGHGHGGGHGGGHR